MMVDVLLVMMSSRHSLPPRITRLMRRAHTLIRGVMMGDYYHHNIWEGLMALSWMHYR